MKSKRPWTFLADYEANGAGYQLLEFCRMRGYSHGTYKWWRKNIEGFKARFEAVRQAHADGIADGTRVRRPLPLANFGVKVSGKSRVWGQKWKGKLDVFLERLRENHDRVAAAQAADTTWKKVREALETDPEFRERYLEVMEEAVARAEDANLIKAMEGNASAAQLKAIREYALAPVAAEAGQEAVTEESAKREAGWLGTIVKEAVSADAG